MLDNQAIKVTMSSTKSLFFFLVLLAIGCKTIQPEPLPPLASPPPVYGAFGDSLNAERQGWRVFFTDPVLAALIDSALLHNLDRKMALANIRRAEAELLRARAPLAPQVQALLSGGAERFGDYTMNGIGNYDLNRSEFVPADRRVPNPVTDVFVGFRASWEIDIWGRLDAQRRSATQQVLASMEGEQWLRTNLVAQVATLYYELLALDAEIQVTAQNTALQERAFEIVAAQKEAGRATELAVQQFQAQIYNTRALMFDLRQRIAVVENGLNLLLGRYNGAIPRGTGLTDLYLPARLQTGLPAQLLLHRPDVRQAERLLESAKADVQAARAALLPNVLLSPYAGVQAFRPSVLFLPESAALGLLSSIATPVFNRRGLLAERNARRAAQEAAWLGYQKSLLLAYTEVEVALQQYQNLASAYPAKTSEVVALNRAVEVSNDLYVAGYANYLEVILAQRSALAASIELQEMRKNQFINLVHLYRVLGGG
jgi:outer membrane protein, multidrug efflux system